MFRLADIFGTLKHHVLEQVCKSGAAGLFVARADVVSHVDGDDRPVVIFDGDHSQPVCQPRFFQINVHATASLGPYCGGES